MLPARLICWRTLSVSLYIIASMAPTVHLQLGWIGLGSMGLAMAINIQEHLKQNKLPHLHYANRTISRGDPLRELGGLPCLSIADLVQNVDVVFISVRHALFAKLFETVLK
jgi:pyrroline-5-carboxylate reductase